MSFLAPPRASLEASFLLRLSDMLDPEPPAEHEAPLPFVHYVNRVKPDYIWYPHCVKLAAVLQKVADGEIKRLQVFMPPRHGKSELVSRLFPGYFLYRYPWRWVGLAAYGAELAYPLSRKAKEFFQAAGGTLAVDAKAVKHWETSRGAGLWAAGVGGPATGKGFHLGIIDDSLKDSEAASSEVIREKQKDWYTSTFKTRGEKWSATDPYAAIINVQTRWHEDDLAGWLLSCEDGSLFPQRWHVVSMAAIKEDEPTKIPDTCTLEPDEREVGEPLCAEIAPLEVLRQLEADDAYYFSAMYQQRPTPPGGLMFTSFPVVDALPNGIHKWVRYWDKAGTEGGGDWSVGVLMCKAGGEYFITDVVRGQWSSSQRERIIKDTASADGTHVHQWFEQEPGSGGKESAENSVKMLAGYCAFSERATGEKAVRAQPLASQAQVGNVKLLRKPWNRAFIEEAQLFPNGKHDDQIDAASGAFNKLALCPTPAAGAARPHEKTPPVPSGGRVASRIPDAIGMGLG